MTVYRVFFRKPKGTSWCGPWPEQLVEGPDARDRLMAQPRPRAIHWEVALLHDCETCGDRRPWDGGWRWYGRPDDIEEGRPIRKFCSEQCRPVGIGRRVKRPEGMSYYEWPQLSQFEPDHGGSVHERWKILQEVGDPTAHRKVPMPAWPGPGTCRWCLKPTVVETGKKIGQLAPGRNWHNACYQQYLLHTDAAVQAEFLAKRDGPWCAICGPGDGRYRGHVVYEDWNKIAGFCALIWSVPTEVDHVIPLWKVVELYPRRREFYGPVNLWLLCVPCHKAKSADEAAERAAAKRSTTAG